MNIRCALGFHDHKPDFRDILDKEIKRELNVLTDGNTDEHAEDMASNWMGLWVRRTKGTVNDWEVYCGSHCTRCNSSVYN